MACAAYDLACTWPRAGCTACSMCEDTILGLETTARYRPENPYRQVVGLERGWAGGKLRHPIWKKPCGGHILALVKAGQVFGGGDAVVQ